MISSVGKLGSSLIGRILGVDVFDSRWSVVVSSGVYVCRSFFFKVGFHQLALSVGVKMVWFDVEWWDFMSC